MKPLPQYTNGDEMCSGGGGGESEGSESEGELEAEELSLEDAEAPRRALAALNALRKSRQHCDVVLVAGAGGLEVPAHRAVLAAASPYLLEALAAAPPTPAPAPAPVPSPAAATSPVPSPASAPAPEPYRVEEVEGEALRALVEYAYTGRLVVREPADARRLYRAAWRLRVEPARAHLADRLLRRLHPADCIAVRALPGLKPDHLQQLDHYIATNFEEVCKSGALATLPRIRIEVMREGGGAGAGAGGGEEAPLTVADAALAWLQDQPATDRDFSELCSRTHLVYVDERGALRDCGELPHAEGDAPDLVQYRREAAARPPAPAPAHPPAECAVLAARGAPGGATTALLAVRGRLAAARVTWRAGAVRAGRGRVGARAGDAPRARPLPGGAAARPRVPARRQRRPRGARLGGGVLRGRGRGRGLGRGRGHVAGGRAAAARGVARGRRGGRGARRAVRGGRVVLRRVPAQRVEVRAGRGPVDRGALARHRSGAVRGRVLAGRRVGGGRVRRVALPRLGGAAAPARGRGGRVGARARARRAAPLDGRVRVAWPARRVRRLRRRRLAAPHRLARARLGATPPRRTRRGGRRGRGRGRVRVDAGAGTARGARRRRPRRARGHAVRGGRVRREGVPRVRRVPHRARPTVEHPVRAGPRAHAAARRPRPRPRPRPRAGGIGDAAVAECGVRSAAHWRTREGAARILGD